MLYAYIRYVTILYFRFFSDLGIVFCNNIVCVEILGSQYVRIVYCDYTDCGVTVEICICSILLFI